MDNTMTPLTAKKLRKLEGWKGDARLYSLSAPVTYEDDRTTDHIIVSAVVALFSGPETMVFSADASGEPLSFLEMAVACGLDHAAAIARLGAVLDGAA